MYYKDFADLPIKWRVCFGSLSYIKNLPNLVKHMAHLPNFHNTLDFGQKMITMKRIFHKERLVFP